MGVAGCGQVGGEIIVDYLPIAVPFTAEEPAVANGTQVASTGERIFGKYFPPPGKIKHFSGVAADVEIRHFIGEKDWKRGNRHDASPFTARSYWLPGLITCR